MPSWTLESLEAEFPQVKWRQPAVVIPLGGSQPHYACRICIANNGLHGSAIPKLPTEPEPIIEHLRTMHRA